MSRTCTRKVSAVWACAQWVCSGRFAVCRRAGGRAGGQCAQSYAVCTQCERAVSVQSACSGHAVHMEAANEWGRCGRGVPAREPPRAPRRAPPPARGRAAVRRCWVGARMEGGGEGRGVGVELGVSWAARPLLLVLSEPALGSPLIQDLLACCTPRQDLFAPVGLPLLAPRAHRHAEELLRIGVAEQPCLPAPGAHAVELVGLDSLPRSAGPGVRRLARGARRRARVVVERAGGHRHGLRRTERGAFENGAHREDICVSLSTYGQCMPHAAATALGLGQVPSSRPPFSRANIKLYSSSACT